MTAAALEARRANLLRANAIRTRRSRYKADLKARNVDPLDALAETPEFLAGMLVYEWLLAMPLVGKSKALRIMRGAQVSTTRTLGSLTERERLALASRMRRP